MAQIGLMRAGKKASPIAGTAYGPSPTALYFRDFCVRVSGF